MFLMDIQREQVDGVRAFLADPAHGAGQFRLIPVLRARVTGVSGRETELESFEDVRARGSLAREYTITYRDHLEANETDRRRARSGPVRRRSRKCRSSRASTSVSDRRRRHGALRHPRPDHQRAGHQHPRGRLARFAQRRLHVRVPARACSIEAPQTFISPLKGPDDAEARARFQHDLVEQFPNVSVIDFHEILVDDPRRHVEGDAGDHAWSAAWCCSAAR